MDFTLDNTQKGRPCIFFLKHKYRLKRTLVNGDISWCCLGKNCGASVRTDSHKTVLTVVNEKHSGQHPVTMRSLTPDSRSAPRSNGASPSVLSLQDSLSASPLLSPLTGRKSRSDSGTQTEDNHMKTKDELIERINQLTHQQSCLVLQCQSMLLQLEEKDNELSSLKNTPTRAKEVAVQTEELPDTYEEPCKRCVILNEEARNMIQTIRTLEEEHVRLQNTWQEHNETEYSRAVDNMFNSDNNSTQLQSPFPLSNTDSFLPDKNNLNLNTEEFIKVKRRTRKRKRNSKTYLKKETMQNFRKQPKHYLEKTTEPPQKLHVFADSHGKDIYKFLTYKVSPCCKVFVDACLGAPMAHVLDNAHSMMENFTKDDTVVIIAGANDLSDVTTKNKQPARVLVDEVKKFIMTHNHTNFVVVSMFHRHHDPWNSYINKEVRGINMELRESLEEVGAAMVDVSLLGRHLFTQHVGAFRHDSCGCTEASSGRRSTPVVGLRPGLASRISSSAKSQMHERLLTPLPTNCLQHESYAGAVRSTPRTGLRLPAAVGGAPADAPGVSSASVRSPVAVQPSSPPSPAASCVSTSIPLEPRTSDIGTLSDAVNTFPIVPNEGNQSTNLKNCFLDAGCTKV
ncbi:hypothetical protein J6590_030688 [Homalodisca vitripennis]|nr:hypothetical protein J6590_030688 [Homalodisca vitripennis]